MFYSEVNGDSDGDGTPNLCEDCPFDGDRSPDLLEQCDNGVDDDCDGLTDGLDDDCCLGVDTTFDEGDDCFDSVDNDCDGLADGLDPDCAGSACDAAAVPATLALLRGDVLVSGSINACNAGPAPGICETDATTAMAWLAVPILDPDSLGWSLELCAPDASAVIEQQTACVDGECLPRDRGCYVASGVGSTTRTFGLGSTGSTCEVDYTLELTNAGGEQ